MERTCLCLLFWPTIASRWVRLLLFVTQVATKPSHMCSTWEYYRNIFAHLVKWKYPPDNRGQSHPSIFFRNLSGLVKSGWGNKVGGCSTARAPHYLNFRPFWARARRATRQWVSPAATAAGEGRPSQPQTSSPPYSAAGNHARDWKKGFLFEEVEVVQYLGKAVCNGVQRRRCRQCSAIVFSVVHPWHQTNRCHSQWVSQSITS